MQRSGFGSWVIFSKLTAVKLLTDRFLLVNLFRFKQLHLFLFLKDASTVILVLLKFSPFSYGHMTSACESALRADGAVAVRTKQHLESLHALLDSSQTTMSSALNIMVKFLKVDFHCHFDLQANLPRGSLKHIIAEVSPQPVDSHTQGLSKFDLENIQTRGSYIILAVPILYNSALSNEKQCQQSHSLHINSATNKISQNKQ